MSQSISPRPTMTGDGVMAGSAGRRRRSDRDRLGNACPDREGEREREGERAEGRYGYGRQSSLAAQRQDGDVVGGFTLPDERADRRHEVRYRLGRAPPRLGKEAEEPLVAEELVLLVHRLRDSVGVEDQRVPRLELEGDPWHLEARL